ncbi:MAG: GNAT family N-acetyltransferase [Spirochaetes bacterium]|nr:GNAT family N-acetyltransferase [Spirochaetota bacterium]
MVELEKMLTTEIEYVKKFSCWEEDEQIIRFWDDKISDMYSHNFTYIKSDIMQDNFNQIILTELERRKAENATFLRLAMDFPIDLQRLEQLPLQPELTSYDYMYFDIKNMEFPVSQVKQCSIKKAVTKEIMADGIYINIQANGPAMEWDFAKRRINRKSEVYWDMESQLDLYVCYLENKPVGICELLTANDIAKIEDFDIYKDYQRMGLGTAVLKYLLDEIRAKKIDTAYLITESADTAKDMYKKCGFKKAGEKNELFFNLR